MAKINYSSEIRIDRIIERFIVLNEIDLFQLFDQNNISLLRKFFIKTGGGRKTKKEIIAFIYWIDRSWNTQLVEPKPYISGCNKKHCSSCPDKASCDKIKIKELLDEKYKEFRKNFGLSLLSCFHAEGIMVCPYCNIHPTEYVGNGLYSLDHISAKTSNPLRNWLNLYNMITSCHVCNSQLKSTRETIFALFNGKNFNQNEDPYTKFSFKVPEIEHWTTTDLITLIDLMRKKNPDWSFSKQINLDIKILDAQDQDRVREYLWLKVSGKFSPKLLERHKMQSVVLRESIAEILLYHPKYSKAYCSKVLSHVIWNQTSNLKISSKKQREQIHRYYSEACAQDIIHSYFQSKIEARQKIHASPFSKLYIDLYNQIA